MRFVPIAAYAVLAVALVARNGIPLAGDMLLLWLVGGLLVLAVAAGSRRWRTLLVDWLPFAGALTLYDVLRGVGGGRVPIHWSEQVWVAEHLFGEIPSVWLQARLWDPAHIRWYDDVSWLVYSSYYVATFVALAVLWWVRRDLFRRYAALLVGMWLFALVLFTAAPTMPPWLASEKGLIGHVDRIIGPIGAHFPVNANSAWERGVRLTNDLAAFPSLHQAMTVLLTLFFWPFAGRTARVLLVAYPVAMAWALVYTGEHYVADLLAGTLLAALVVQAERWLRSERGAAQLDRLRARRARAVGADDQPAVRPRPADDRLRP